jgi:hypothetical protein
VPQLTVVFEVVPNFQKIKVHEIFHSGRVPFPIAGKLTACVFEPRSGYKGMTNFLCFIILFRLKKIHCFRFNSGSEEGQKA